MSTYSTDSDLSLYVRDTNALPLPLTRFHTEAGRVIDQFLSKLGLDSDDIAALTADSTAQLTAPACHYVLYLYYQSYYNDPDLLQRAKHHLGEYQRLLETVSVETDTSSSAVSSGYCKLG